MGGCCCRGSSANTSQDKRPGTSQQRIHHRYSSHAAPNNVGMVGFTHRQQVSPATLPVSPPHSTLYGAIPTGQPHLPKTNFSPIPATENAKDGNAMQHTTSPYKPKSLVDINTANVHELCLLESITPQLANNIVEYRCRNGRFSSVSDLLDVPGISHQLLQRIQPRIKISSLASNSGKSPHKPGKSQQGPRSKSKEAVPLSETVVVIRPPSDTIRIGSWNLQCFSTAKASNAGILQAVCLTILTHGLHLVALQELGNKEALQRVCNELNHPTTEKLKSWVGKTGHWKCVVSEPSGRMFQGLEHGGLLWNEDAGIQLMKSGLLGKPSHADNEKFVRRPFIGSFQVGNSWKFLLISVHLKAVGWGGVHCEQLKAEIHLLVPLIEAATESAAGRDIIVVGDFNVGPEDSSFQELLQKGYKHLLPAGVPTNISGRNPRGNCSYDNIWVSSQASTLRHSGQFGVIREGLLVEGNTVSDHCPIWAEFKL